MVLVSIDYSSDSERKRIDYAITRWENKLKIRKPSGTLIFIDGQQNLIEEFLEDVSSRIVQPEKKIKIKNMTDYAHDIKKDKFKLKYESKKSIESVINFLNYVMSKIGARNVSNITGVGKQYSVSTKKGQGKILVQIIQNEESADINIIIEGYGDVVEFLSNKIDNEMKIFLEG